MQASRCRRHFVLLRCSSAYEERRNDEAARLLLERHKEAEAESKEARAEAMLKTAREEREMAQKEREMAQKERQDVEYNLGHTKDELGKAKNEYRQVGTDGEGGDNERPRAGVPYAPSSVF